MAKVQRKQISNLGQVADTPVDFIWTSATDNSFDPLDATVVQLSDDGVFTGNHTINGITGGTDGRVLVIYNDDSTFTLTLNHENGSASATDRIHQIDTISPVLAPGEYVQIRYGGSRWRADFVFQGALSGADTIDVNTDLTIGGTSVMPVAGSSTDNAAVRWDGTTGALVEDGPLIISDIAANAFTMDTPDAGTGTDITIKAGNSTTSNIAGADLNLRSGDATVGTALGGNVDIDVGATAGIPLGTRDVIIGGTTADSVLIGRTTAATTLKGNVTLADIDLPVASGGTGAGTAQAAIDTLTNVSGATNEHVLTKDTGSGNAIFKVNAAGDFSGPGVSIDNEIVRFTGTGGKTGQQSGVLITDEVTNSFSILPVATSQKHITVEGTTPSDGGDGGDASLLGGDAVTSGNGGDAHVQAGAEAGAEGPIEGTVNVGTVNGQTVEISKTGKMTNINGNLTVDGSVTFTTDLPIASGGTASSTAATAIHTLIDGATNDTSLQYTNVFGMSDGAGKKISWGNMMGEGKSITEAYTGSGSSGKTVTLTGINRASMIIIHRNQSGSNSGVLSIPNGATGSVGERLMSSAAWSTQLSLDAPTAGTSQVLTINGTGGSLNASGVSYTVTVIGTPI